MRRRVSDTYLYKSRRKKTDICRWWTDASGKGGGGLEEHLRRQSVMQSGYGSELAKQIGEAGQKVAQRKIKIKNVGKFLLKGTVVPFCVSVCIRFSQNAETKKMKNQKL